MMCGIRRRHGLMPGLQLHMFAVLLPNQAYTRGIGDSAKDPRHCAVLGNRALFLRQIGNA